MDEAVNNSLPLNIVTLFIPVLFHFLGLNSNFEQFKVLVSEKNMFDSNTNIEIGPCCQFLRVKLGFCCTVVKLGIQKTFKL